MVRKNTGENGATRYLNHYQVIPWLLLRDWVDCELTE